MRIIDECISKNLTIRISTITIYYGIESHSSGVRAVDPLPILPIANLLEYNVLKYIMFHLILNNLCTGIGGIDYGVYAASLAVLPALALIIVRRRRAYTAEDGAHRAEA